MVVVANIVNPALIKTGCLKRSFRHFDCSAAKWRNLILNLGDIRDFSTPLHFARNDDPFRQPIYSVSNIIKRSMRLVPIVQLHSIVLQTVLSGRSLRSAF